MFFYAFNADIFKSTIIGHAIEMLAVIALMDDFKFRYVNFNEKPKKISEIKNMGKIITG